MLLKSIRSTGAVAVTNFIGECADDFFHLKIEQTALAYATRLGLIRVYACVGSDYLVRYFRSIYEQDPARFFRLDIPPVWSPVVCFSLSPKAFMKGVLHLRNDSDLLQSLLK